MCKAIDDMILEGKQQGIQEGIKALIEVAKELDVTTDIIEKKVEEKFNLSKDEAVEAVNKYYKQKIKENVYYSLGLILK